ncbi:helix-turn-helix domain-containing protein, partial [Hydrogenibacillus schlegelii]|uniref:helix-turn-helix domain-containing protein n=1 Tax=Hydrogenibacillus schlegelii TaxID=1484 RepID=UPI0023578854
MLALNADRLVHLRKSRGLTQKEVADKLKISRSSYAQYELGRRRPDYETLIGIANLYDVSIDYLLGRTDNPRPPSSEQTSENKTSATSICSKDPYQQMIDDDTPADESHETVRSIDLKRLLDEIKARLNEFDEIKDRLTNLQRYLSLIASFSFEADDMSKSKFAERLRKLRLKMGISQIELAEKIGVSNFAVSRYERGATSPDPEIIIKLADFFGVTTDYLLGRTDDPTPTSENTSPSPSPPPNRTRSDAPSRPKDPYQQMI